SSTSSSEPINDGSGNSAGDNFPEWFWDGEESSLTLRWHGVHSLVPGKNEAENDLLITSNIPGSSENHALAGAVVAAGVMVAITFLVWALASKIFLFDTAPLKMTGELRLAEAIREGRSVLVLLPPVSDWRLKGPKWTVDLKKIATGPRWAENLD